MTHSAEQSERQESAPQVVEATPVDHSLDNETGIVEGKVNEIAQTGPAEQGVTQTGSQQDDSQAQDQQDDSSLKQDRAALKEHLLKHAPAERVMRKQVEKVLVEKRQKLEGDIRKHRRRGDYHLLSKSIAQLRQVLRELEKLAKLGLEALRDSWLRVVHKFA